MFQSQKHAFWQALLITVLIFSIGIITGVILENWRTSKINDLYKKSEIDLLDIKLQAEIYSSGNFNCEEAIKENVKFADKIFEEAKILDRYETASRLTESIVFEHKKYDLLRTMLFLNSIEIKEKCNNSYYEVVYFYKYNEPNYDIKAKQNVFSKLLKDLKEIKGGNVLLIPIAGNNDISAVNLLLEEYEVSEEEMPVILINRKTKVKDVLTIEELLKYFE